MKATESFPLGDYLREEMAARGWTIEHFVALVALPRQTIQAILDNPDHPLLISEAQRVGLAFGCDPTLFLNLSLGYRRRKK